jgi:hypothetical protein
MKVPPGPGIMRRRGARGEWFRFYPQDLPFNGTRMSWHCPGAPPGPVPASDMKGAGHEGRGPGAGSVSVLGSPGTE